MKSRGIRPSPLSYATIFSYLAQAQHLPDSIKSFATDAWETWQNERIALVSSQGSGPMSEELLAQITASTDAYISYLIYQVSVQAALDVFYSLPINGPYAATTNTYTSIFRALTSTSPETHVRTAQSIWTTLVRKLGGDRTGNDNSSIKLDARLVGACFEVLRHDENRSTAQNFAIRHFCIPSCRSADRNLQAPYDSRAFLAVLVHALVGRQYGFILRTLGELTRSRPKDVDLDILSIRAYDIALSACDSVADADTAERKSTHLQLKLILIFPCRADYTLPIIHKSPTSPVTNH